MLAEHLTCPFGDRYQFGAGRNDHARGGRGHLPWCPGISCEPTFFKPAAHSLAVDPSHVCLDIQFDPATARPTEMQTTSQFSSSKLSTDMLGALPDQLSSEIKRKPFRDVWFRGHRHCTVGLDVGRSAESGEVFVSELRALTL